MQHHTLILTCIHFASPGDQIQGIDLLACKNYISTSTRCICIHTPALLVGITTWSTGAFKDVARDSEIHDTYGTVEKRKSGGIQ